MKAVLVLLSIIAVCGMVSYASADTINWNQCANNPDHHCYTHNAKLSATPGFNEAVVIILPQNGASHIMGVFSADNYSNLEQNPAVMAVQFSSTSASPTLNYCPNAKYILQNQGVPEYLDRLYNIATGLDLTILAYPTDCFAESGPNPITGSSAIPEFPQVAMIVASIGIMSAIVFTAKRGHTQ